METDAIICEWCKEEIEDIKFDIVRVTYGTIDILDDSDNKESYLPFHEKCFKHLVLTREL